MLVLFFALLLVVGACLILLAPALWTKQIYDSYRDPRAVNCPETHAQVAVRFNAWRAALSAMRGKPQLSLADCTRWPERAGCDQACIHDAEQAAPPPDLSLVRSYANRVTHLPALAAAFAAWVLGVAWHSEYVFRPLWAKAVGLSDQQAYDLAGQLTPHLLTVSCCLLFSYGVAAALAWQGSRSVWRGIQTSLTLWLVISVALILVNPLSNTPDLLWIEGGYTFLAALLVGAVNGGLPLPRRLLPKESR